MIHTCCTAGAERDQLFRQAAASGAKLVRLDVELHGIVKLDAAGNPYYDWVNLDAVVASASRYGLAVLADLYGTPGG